MSERSLRQALERLTKWRAHFAGWQLGTRTADDPESRAVRDHRELTILLRAESNALLGLLLEKGVITQEEWQDRLEVEAAALEKMYEQTWPGARASALGMQYDLAKAREWMKGWRP